MKHRMGLVQGTFLVLVFRQHGQRSAGGSVSACIMVRHKKNSVLYRSLTESVVNGKAVMYRRRGSILHASKVSYKVVRSLKCLCLSLVPLTTCQRNLTAIMDHFRCHFLLSLLYQTDYPKT